MSKLFATVLLTVLATGAFAQFTLTGIVTEEKTGQVLSGATVQIQASDRFAITDTLGRFTFEKVSRGKYTLWIRFLGHADRIMNVSVPSNNDIEVVMEEVPYVTDEVIVEAIRASDKTPTTFATVDKQEIMAQNFGQDLPYLLNWSPSLVTTSDAGTGIGYTGLRIRGSDATRINVTINGIPYNDSESLGTFWVDIPDIASSSQSIQIQRGVGTSTNGSGAFGGTVNVQTDVQREDPFAEVTASFGSFNTHRYTAAAGTGLLNKHWSVEGRISRIESDGYIDRASSDLSSYYISGTYHAKKTILKGIVFGGHEVTYQSWYGIDPEQMKISRTFNYAGAIYDENWNVLRYYDNQTDNYSQDHAQLHFSQALAPNTTLTVALHYTFGRGYYEEYNQDIPLESLGLNNITLKDTTITRGDYITRKWLENHFYGTTFSLTHTLDKLEIVFGGGYHRYAPAYHYGEILWGEYSVNLIPRQRYYNGESDKTDFNMYAKLTYDLADQLIGFIDLQYRKVDYETSGTKDNQSAYSIADKLTFFNPKVGLSYSIGDNSLMYLSYAVAHLEPARTDYLENEDMPRPERLRNLEFGWRKKTKGYQLNLNYYLMSYKDQLVLTGALDNVGNPIRANVGRSYRTGIEMSGNIKVTPQLTWNLNATWSRNENLDYVWEDNNNESRTANTAIILSPDWIAGSQLNWNAAKNFDITLLSKYVSRQYLDNTENESLTLGHYFVNDLRLSHKFHPAGTRGLEFSLLINNLTNTKYASNGYAYDGVPYYYPQAGINFLCKLSLKL
jgi:iron complex outermembrane recepter protein